MNTAARLNLRLTPRDLEILVMVYRYDGCVNSHIRRRFWPSFGARSPYYQRLSRLINAGYLRAVRLPSVKEAGSGPSWLTIGRGSHPVLRAALALGQKDLRRLRHSYVPMFWRHDAACRDFRLTLELACERSTHARLTEWIGDRDLKRRPITAETTFPWGERGSFEVPLIPDAAFTLERPSGESKRFFLEIDRGTELTPQRFKRKVKNYIVHLAEAPSPVLFVVPTESRRRQLHRWIQEEAKSWSKIFATACTDEISQETILHGAIWQIIGEPTPLPLVPCPSPGEVQTLSQVGGQGELWRS